MNNKPTLLIINGSFRENSFTGHFAHILGTLANELFNIEQLSVRELNLPNFEYPQANHPSAHILKQRVLQADGIIIISPEYHGCISGALKNALDYIKDEFTDKPIGVLATAGSPKSGTNAMNTLRTICRSLQADVLTEQLNLSKQELTEGQYLTGKLLDRCESLIQEMQLRIAKNQYFYADTQNYKMAIA